MLTTASYLLFRSPRVQTYLVNWVMKQLADTYQTKIKVGGVNISLFNKIVLEEVLIEDQSRDTLAYVGKVALGIDSLKLTTKRLHISDITLIDPLVRISKFNENFNFSFLTGHSSQENTSRPSRWHITYDDFAIRNGRFDYKNLNDTTTQINGVNFSDIRINRFNLTLVNLLETDSATTFFIDNASLQEKSGFVLGDLRFKAQIDSMGFHINNLTLVSNLSNIESSYLNIKKKEELPTKTDSLGNPVEIPITDQYLAEGELNESILSLSDLAYFLPEIWGMDEKLKFSGQMRGSLSNLKFRKLNLKIGEKTQFNADLELMGLPEWQKTFIYFKFYDNVFNLTDLARIKMPDLYPRRYPRIPNEDVTLTYKGNFSGFPSDFVAYGTLGGDFGTLSTDIALKPNANGEIDFSGYLKTRSFQIGRVLGHHPLGAVTMHINVKGSRRQQNRFNVIAKGAIDSIYYNNYRIDSIYIDGHAREKSYEGQLDIRDENLKLTFAGKADLESKIPVFNFRSTLERANLNILGIDKKYARSEMAYTLEANFTGKHIDDLNGEIDLKNFFFARNNKQFDVRSLKLVTNNNENKNSLTVRSDLADIDIDGKYYFRDFDSAIRDILSYYIPSAKLPFSSRKAQQSNSFKFNVNLKNPAYITHFFLPEIVPLSPITINGELNSANKTLVIDGTTDNIMIAGNELKGLTLTSRNYNNKWSCRIGTEKATIRNSIVVDNLSLNNLLGNDSIHTTLSWSNNSPLTYSGKVDALSVFSKDHEGVNMTDIYLQPSNIWVADSLWKIDDSRIHLDSTQMTVSNFKIHHNNQFFRINGNVTDDPSDYIKVEMEKISLGYLDLILEEKIGINAILNGEVTLSDPYHALFLTSDLKLDNFSYNGENFGNMSLENLWNKEEKRLYSTIKLLNENKAKLLLKGYYQPSNDTISASGDFDDFPVETLHPFLSVFADRLEGSATGKVNITGTISDPNFQGKVDIKNGLIGIDYTKVAYSFNEPVIFSDDSIMFRRMTLYDPEKNSALFDGYITQKMFSNLSYNMLLETDNMLSLDTRLNESSMFYGKAHCAGQVRITGYRQNVKLDLALTTRPGTQIYIPLENNITASNYDFIRFVSPDTANFRSIAKNVPVEEDGFEMELAVQATPDAKIQINFSSAIGDVIYGQGNGNLRMIYDKLDNFYIYGNYEVEKGDYLFTLQNVIGKKFKLEEGGSISWDGDPYGANVDLNAVYKLKTSVYDLLLDTYQGDNSRRIPVECKINLSKKLLNPAIKFDILFPTADERTKDELQQFISTQDDINRQMLSLLVMGQFFTPDYLRGRQNFESNTGDIVGATTSEMLSNQLSNWLSQISNNFDIGFNYRPGDQVNINQMEVALSTQILNDRVTINGNIGNNSSLLTNTTNPFVGELEVFVKLDKTGRLQLKAYNRANDDLIYDAAPYKQGLGLSYRKSFDSLYELFQKYRQKNISSAAATTSKAAKKAVSNEKQ